MQRKGDGAMFAILVAVAVAREGKIVNAFGSKGNETEAVGDEFVGEDRGVGFDFDEVDS